MHRQYSPLRSSFVCSLFALTMTEVDSRQCFCWLFVVMFHPVNMSLIQPLVFCCRDPYCV